MAYIDVLPLATAKAYLKVEHSDSDAEITAMINTACAYLEKVTGHIFYSRSITYELAGKNWIRVHDYPITAVVKGIDKDGVDVTLTFETNYDVYKKTLHTIYEQIDSDADQLVLTVGYADPADVPSGLVDAAKMIVKGLYYSYEAESIDEVLNVTMKEIINSHKRFLV